MFISPRPFIGRRQRHYYFSFATCASGPHHERAVNLLHVTGPINEEAGKEAARHKREEQRRVKKGLCAFAVEAGAWPAGADGGASDFRLGAALVRGRASTGLLRAGWKRHLADRGRNFVVGRGAAANSGGARGLPLTCTQGFRLPLLTGWQIHPDLFWWPHLSFVERFQWRAAEDFRGPPRLCFVMLL